MVDDKLSSSGQAPPLTGEEIESMLKENQYVRICTHNKDGTIHAVPVSYRYMNGQIVIMSITKSRKNRNIERNNDVTVLIDTLDPLRGILIYGTAELDRDNVYEQALTFMEALFHGMPKEKVQRITKAYLDAFESVIVKITPKHIITFDYTKDVAWQNFLKTYLQE
jgi:nitroimidazol reductase NimA-like FMN-containing flavoprotein (pyridoxamine 5'-phosphate oxidase superfamily)